MLGDPTTGSLAEITKKSQVDSVPELTRHARRILGGHSSDEIPVERGESKSDSCVEHAGGSAWRTSEGCRAVLTSSTPCEPRVPSPVGSWSGKCGRPRLRLLREIRASPEPQSNPAATSRDDRRVSRMCRESVQSRSTILQRVEYLDFRKSVLRRRYREMSETVARCLSGLLIRLPWVRVPPPEPWDPSGARVSGAMGETHIFSRDALRTRFGCAVSVAGTGT